MAIQTLRDNVLYAYGYLQGRSYSLTDSASRVYGLMISKISSFISLPLPFLSFLALPFFGSTSTSINLVFFYLTWSALVLSHDPLNIEIYGTLATRLLFYLLPSLTFLAFDVGLPGISASIKSRGAYASPMRLGRRKLMLVSLTSTINVLLAILLQAGIEHLLTDVLTTHSALRVSKLVPPPWTIAKHIVLVLIMRGLIHYPLHRYIMHASHGNPLTTLHTTWAHSLRFQFSLSAAYDHPLCHILLRFVPLYLPASTLRVHVLTWHILVALTSLEELLLFSGYSVLPSKILVAGMARRTEAHYASSGKGSFGSLGLLDWVCGTGCKGEESFVDDLKDEAEKRDVKGKVSDVMTGRPKTDEGEEKDADETEDVHESAIGPSEGARRRSKRNRKVSATS
ncbi:hypothetical protein H2203_003255 [Taxawa tesnikishii (nom. ined.)]|nr:hypothetical protein H2203_003255 [Dothideales sp. JES 119]